ncbi:MAG: homoserine kinase [Coriobacteriaceae bacterium]|nr:homoserine kinase [Coriobacteriaceae bacterium]
MAAPALRVSVPASSANLGVGFDCLGIALDLRATFSFDRSDALVIDGCDPALAGDDNLVWTSYCETCARLGRTAVPLHISIDSPIPITGGLGSSSACVIAGIIAAQVLVGDGFNRADALEEAILIEGHPDNVAPALLGGLASSCITEEGRTIAIPHAISSVFHYVVMAPSYEVRTVEARKALPATYALGDIVTQMGRYATVINALETGNAKLLGTACHDLIHEPYRAKLIPDYTFLKGCALGNGAAAFTISGSGSAMLAICAGRDAAEQVAEAVRDQMPDLWIRILPVDTRGTIVEVER